MIGFLASRFIKDYQNTSDAAVRRAYGVLCGAVGIAINLLLFALKLFAGTLAGSVAITADAFNNLSDAGASIVTLLGFRLAGQKPDPEHPFGHGRLEYISGLIVSIVILLMGFELLRDAVVPYGCKMSDREAEEKIKKAVHELDPRYFAIVQIDKSYVR